MFGAALALGGLSLLGGYISHRMSDANNDRSDRFARNYVQIRSADARRAGINPLFALGAPAIQPSISQLGSDYGLSQAGQDLSRMASVYADRRQRQAVIDLELKKGEADIRNVELKNAVLSHQLSQQLRGPSLSSDPGLAELGIMGQGDPVPNVTVNPLSGDSASVPSSLGVDYVKPEVPYSSSLGVAAGISPFYESYIDERGEVWKVPSSDLAESMEDNLVLQLQYGIEEAKRMVGSWWDRIKVADPRLRVDVLRTLRSQQPAAPIGYVFRWNFGSARWKLEPQRYSGDNYPIDPKIRTLLDIQRQLEGRDK